MGEVARKAVNRAKFREAIEKARSEIDCIKEPYNGVSYDENGYAVSGEPVDIIEADDAQNILTDIEQATISSPRNCDRFANWRDAVQAFEQAVSPRWRQDWTAEDFWQCIGWLFSEEWDGRDWMDAEREAEGGAE